jgi:cardiolipin synthase
MANGERGRDRPSGEVVPRRRWRPVPRPRARRDRPARRRVEAQARALPEGVRSARFAELLHRIDESPVHPRNRVEIYTDGTVALGAMLDTIERAESEILLQSYIFKDDRAGQQVVEALGRARERGVAVRVLADALGSLETRESFWQRLGRLRLDFHLFNPLRYPWLHLFRDHRKILVVDRMVAFTGGMNIGEEYGSAPAGTGFESATGGPRAEAPLGQTWRDTHLRVVGDVVWELAVVFRESWQQAGGQPFSLPPLIERGDAGDLEAPGGDTTGARCLVLDSRAGRGHRETALCLRALVAAARRRLWITNAYFAPSWAALGALCRAARAGVDVRLLLPGKSDVRILRAAARGCYSHLLRHGVRIFEYQPVVLHAKTVVADGFASVVGSSNLDFRSFNFNHECNLVILDEAVGQRLEQAFREDLERAREIDRERWAHRRWRQRAAERMARWLSPLL